MTQGFNPHPKLSLALPRPVGVGSLCELMVVELCAGPTDAEWANDLRRQLPHGMKLLRWERPGPGPPPMVSAASYELTLQPDEPAGVQARLAELATQQKWEVTRQSGRRRRPPAGEKRINLKAGVSALAVKQHKLAFTITHTPAGAPRCEEVLALVGLGSAHALAQLVRTDLECSFQTQQIKIRNTNS